MWPSVEVTTGQRAMLAFHTLTRLSYVALVISASSCPQSKHYSQYYYLVF